MVKKNKNLSCEKQQSFKSHFIRINIFNWRIFLARMTEKDKKKNSKMILWRTEKQL